MDKACPERTLGTGQGHAIAPVQRRRLHQKNALQIQCRLPTNSLSCPCARRSTFHAGNLRSVYAAGMRIELNCAECGENRFNLGEGIEGDAIVRCKVCGHKIGTLAELKERIAAEVMRRVQLPD